MLERLHADGRLESLAALAVQAEWFGCSSGADEEAAAVGLPRGAYRHTVCIELPATDQPALLPGPDRYQLDFPASAWVRFKLTKEQFFDGRRYPFWEHDPYGMIKRLGYSFNWKIAVHLDVFTHPDTGIFNVQDPLDRQRMMSFWMPVG